MSINLIKNEFSLFSRSQTQAAISRLNGEDRKILAQIFSEKRSKPPFLKLTRIYEKITADQPSSNSSFLGRILKAISIWWHQALDAKSLTEIIWSGSTPYTKPKESTRPKKVDLDSKESRLKQIEAIDRDRIKTLCKELEKYKNRTRLSVSEMMKINYLKGLVFNYENRLEELKNSKKNLEFLRKFPKQSCSKAELPFPFDENLPA